MQSINSSPAANGNLNDSAYDHDTRRMRRNFLARCGNSPVFTTKADDLWGRYLACFSNVSDRQHHNCHTCRRFVEQYGGLAIIRDGRIVSAVWEPSDWDDHGMRLVSESLKSLVEKSPIRGVFYVNNEVTSLGINVTGSWRHLSLTPTESMVATGALNARQQMASKLEDYRNVASALGAIRLEPLRNAVLLLEYDSLYRSEKVLGNAKWLLGLKERMSVSLEHRQTILWDAVAHAPNGFCHPRSSMIWTLLEDLESGMDIDLVSRRFKSKMNPLQYQRPQAAPSDATIAQAESLIEKLNLRLALRRRYARLDDIQAVWRPVEKVDLVRGDVFGHLKKSEQHSGKITIPQIRMSWVRFRDEIMPMAMSISIRVPPSGPFAAFVTSVDPSDPPILQWDHEELRNPVSWYFQAGGSAASHWKCRGGDLMPVDAISLKPSMWFGGVKNQGSGVMFVIRGAAETRVTGGNALFPEIMKPDLHGVRSVIEKYSRGEKIAGVNEPHVAGLMYDKGRDVWDVDLLVETPDSFRRVFMDRWE